MLVFLFLKSLFGESLTEVGGGAKNIKSVLEKTSGINFFELSSGNGIGLEHKGRKFLFTNKEDDKILSLLKFVDRFDAAYPDMPEIVSKLNTLENESEYDEIKRGGKSFAIFFINEESIPKLKTLETSLKTFLSTDKELAGKINTPFPGIYGYNAGDKVGYSLKVRDDYFRAANTILTPVFDLITEENMRIYETAENPTFYILAHSKDHENLKKEFKNTARKLRNEVQLCLMAYEGGRTNIKGMGLKEGSLPAILIIKDNLKYREPNVTPEKAEEFVKGFVGKKIKNFVLSGVEPADNDKNAVKVIVYSGREKWLKDKTRDKLVVFQAPWCKFCKNLKPVIEKLGEKAQKYSKNKVMVGTFDMTENESPELEVRGYPTIYLIKAETNEEVLFKGSDRSLKSLAEFLKANGHHKVDLESLMPQSEKDEL